MLLRLFVSSLLILTSNAQFSNFFAQMMSGNGQAGTSSGSVGNQNAGNGNSNCITASVSCLPAPWCKRTVDQSGCPKCDCGGMSPMMAGGGGKNFPTSGGNPSTSNLFTSMLGGGAGRGFPSLTGFGYGKGPMNPMAMVFGRGSMLGGGSGGSGSPSGMGSFPNPMGQTGSGMSSQSKPSVENSKCDPAPYTCPVPPPWCQRLVDIEGCVKCYCGQQLQEYLQNLQGLITTKSPENQTNTGFSNSTQHPYTSKMTSPKTTTTTTTPPLGMSCLANFMCTLSCDNGYKTAGDGCPLCECIGDLPQSLPSTPATSINLPTDGSVITCPGIFDCQKLCLNGFQTDSQGCPLCQCETD